MKKIRLTEAELTKIVKRVIKEQNQIDTSNFDHCWLDEGTVGEYIINEIISQIEYGYEWDAEFHPEVPSYLEKYVSEINDLIKSEDLMYDVYSAIWPAITDNAEYKELLFKIRNEISENED